MDNLYYSSEKNIQILLALFKSNGIKRIIASPGATNFAFVGSIQNDPYFEVFSCVDERSAAYMACGMAAESREPVVLSCTGSTASRDYIPGLTEAFYRKLPVLAVTSHHGKHQIGHMRPQNIDRSVVGKDVVKLSVELPVIKNRQDEEFVLIEANKAILELFRNGGGPVHINLFTICSDDFSVKELPFVRAIKRFEAWDTLPEMPKCKIAIYLGSHPTFTQKETDSIDRFCATYDALVICDHTSGYYGKYRLLPTLAQNQELASHPIDKLDLMIHIGQVSAATFLSKFNPTEVWRVHEDGEIRDTFHRLTKVFQMSQNYFFDYYSKKDSSKHEFIDDSIVKYKAIYNLIPELPFSNIWSASQLSQKIPKGSLLHISASNSRRTWNMFPLPEGVTSSCNVGCCGIDGCTSTFIGASLINPNRLCYFVTGDLAFFYDVNVLGNRQVGNNVRILLVNNGLGAEFRLYHHQCQVFGTDVDRFIAAAGHNGKQSHQLVKHIAEDLGFVYLTATDKESFLEALYTFTDSSTMDNPMIFEIFTNPENESKALKIMNTISSDAQGVASNVFSSIKSKIVSSGVKTLKKFYKK